MRRKPIQTKMVKGLHLITSDAADSARRGGSREAQILERGVPGSPSARPVETQTRALRLLANPVHSGRSRGGAVARRMDQAQPGHDAYAAMVAELKTRYKISIRKWRSRMSGVAYELKYRDGRIKRLISSPRPRSPVSAAIFLHEVGHHAIGFRRYAPRCLEEYYVWQWAFREMAARNIAIDQRVMRHYRRSMYHYVRQAKKHGVHGLPHELQPFHHWPG